LPIRTELRALLRLAFPIVLTQLSQMGMGVADTVMAGRSGAVDLAGVALGGNLFWPFLFFLSGVIMALTPTVAQLDGRGRSEAAGEAVRQASWIALVGGASLIAVLLNAEPVYRRIGVDPLAIPVATDYLRMLALGVLPALGFFMLRYLSEALSWSMPAMLIAVTALALKIPLNYWFIHGGFGVPAMGGAGCGLASALVLWLEFFVMALVVSRSRLKRVGVFERFSRPDWREIGRLVRLGVPIGLTSFMEISMFAAMSLMIGRLGVDAVAAHQVGANVGGLLFMIPMALGMAAAVRVGFNVGLEDLPAARRAAWVAVAVAVVFSTVAATVTFFNRAGIVGLYANDAGVLELAAALLVFVCIFQLVDAAQVAGVGALRGFKDTRVPLLVAVLAYWVVGLPVGASLGLGLVDVPTFYGVRGFWVGLTAGLSVAALVLLARLLVLGRDDARILEYAGR